MAIKFNENGTKKLISIKENISTERAILKYLTSFKNVPNSFVKYHKFFKTYGHI